MKRFNILHIVFILFVIQLCGCQSIQSPENLNASISQNDELSWEWVVEPTKYKDLFFVDENLLAAQNDDGKYSVIDTHDNIVISAKYDSISEFHDEIAKVESNGNSFYIDKSGNPITDEMFQEVNGFSESLGGVKKMAYGDLLIR